MRLFIVKAFAAALLLMGSGLTSAGLIGDQVTLDATMMGRTVTFLSPSGSNPQNNTVGGSVEFDICVDVAVNATCTTSGLHILMDIGDFAIDFTVTGSIATGGMTLILDLTDLDFSPPATMTDVGVTPQFLDGEGSFSIAEFGQPDNIKFEILGGVNDMLNAGASGTNLHFDIEVEQQLPEPSALALLGLSLAGLGFARRRVTR